MAKLLWPLFLIPTTFGETLIIKVVKINGTLTAGFGGASEKLARHSFHS